MAPFFLASLEGQRQPKGWRATQGDQVSSCSLTGFELLQCFNTQPYQLNLSPAVSKYHREVSSLLDSTIHVKLLVQSLAYSKCSINVSYEYCH